MEYNFLVTSQDKNKRLDIFLQENLKNFTRSQIKNLIDKEDVFINGKKVKKAGQVLKENDEIFFNYKEQKFSLVAQEIPLDIIYEDEHLALINKPQGMVVHPAAGNYSGTLVHALLYHFKKLSTANSDTRPGIVHRLDKDTSGLLLIAKSDTAYLSLTQQIKQKTARRIYRAIVSGVLKEEEGIIDKNLARSQKNRKKIDIAPQGQGRTALTKYKVLERLKGFTYVEFELSTGRTHQIRVHAKSIGHPVLGDIVYGNTYKKIKTEGQLLHAYSLSFYHPITQKNLEFKAPLPTNFEKMLKNLKN